MIIVFPAYVLFISWTTNSKQLSLFLQIKFSQWFRLLCSRKQIGDWELGQMCFSSSETTNNCSVHCSTYFAWAKSVMSVKVEFFLTKSILSQPLETNPYKIVLLLSLASQALLSHNGWRSLFSHMQQSLPLSQTMSLKMVLGFCTCLFTPSCSTFTFSCPSSWLTVSW